MLTRDEADRIEQCVRAAETQTSTEIAVGVLRASGDDRGIAAIIGAVVLILAFVVISVVAPEAGNLVSLGLALALAVAGFVVCDRWDLGLKLLPARLVAKDARPAARAMFLDRGLDATPERNAVLLFISRAERYVEILPDRGLAAQVPQQHWANIVASFREVARKRGMVEAAADAIARIGAACAGPFPATAENQDHIPNRPITE